MKRNDGQQLYEVLRREMAEAARLRREALKDGRQTDVSYYDGLMEGLRRVAHHAFGPHTALEMLCWANETRA